MNTTTVIIQKKYFFKRKKQVIFRNKNKDVYNMNVDQKRRCTEKI